MRIGVVMICTRDLNYREYAIDNSRTYCEKHGYDFVLYENKINPNASAIANKTIGVLENIDKYDWIFMKDSDSLFYNFDIRIENYIDVNYNYIASMSKIIDTVNLGHLLIKCTADVKRELNMVSNTITEKVSVKGEQRIFREHWKTGKISPVKKMPKHIFNAQTMGIEDWRARRDFSDEKLMELDRKGVEYYKNYADIKPDTFIVHYAGVFLKTGTLIGERQDLYGEFPDPFNFSDLILSDFIKLSESIKKRYCINGGKPVKMESVLKPRVQKHNRKKINKRKR